MVFITNLKGANSVSLVFSTHGKCELSQTNASFLNYRLVESLQFSGSLIICRTSLPEFYRKLSDKRLRRFKGEDQ
jgi:hypothetical protein